MKSSSILEKPRFLELVKHFIKLITSSKFQCLKYLPKGCGFSLLKTSESLLELNNITIECFDMNLKELEKQFVRFDFEVRHKRIRNNDSIKTVYKSIEPFLAHDFPRRVVDNSEASLDEEDGDDFPNDEEVEQVMRAKEERLRGLARTHLLRPQSDSVLGAPERRKNHQDISLEVKLDQQDGFSTPQGSGRRRVGRPSEEELQLGACLTERNCAYRENYEECSRLIDRAMAQMLAAHRTRQVGERAEELLGRVVQIYDLLSDNIENVTTTIREFEGRPHPSDHYSSPGFKPIAGASDTSK